jgi:hypothetical protein
MTAAAIGGIDAYGVRKGHAAMVRPRSERNQARPRRKARPATPASSPTPPPRVAADAAEIRRILGPLEDGQLCRVLDCGADVAELQQAAAALAGELPGHIGRPIEGPAARVYDLLVAESFEEPEERARRGATPQ